MNVKELKEIIEVIKDAIKDTDINEFDLEREGIKIRIKKGATGMPVVQMQAPQMLQPVHPAISAPPSASATGAPPAAAAPSADDKFTKIASPMVGTFYRSPAPTAPPFINEGDQVKVGQTLCILEAMKLMNEIKAETAGKIVKILVENGQAIEFGQPLFLIDPAK